MKYLFTNHLGVPERIEDESGRAIWQGEVLPYGLLRLEFGSQDEVNLRFPGHYYDVETGLHYNRFRYYDPTLGRYLQCDPPGVAGGYNLYAYLANPLISVDILGLKAKGSGGGCGGEKSRNNGQTGRHGRRPKAQGTRNNRAQDSTENPLPRPQREISDARLSVQVETG